MNHIHSVPATLHFGYLDLPWNHLFGSLVTPENTWSTKLWPIQSSMAPSSASVELLVFSFCHVEAPYTTTLHILKGPFSEALHISVIGEHTINPPIYCLFVSSASIVNGRLMVP